MNRELNTQDILRLIKIREHGFDVQDGGLVAIKEGKKGTVVKPLANFWAWPTRKISRDDGAAVTTFYDIAGKLPSGKVLPTARLTHEEFFWNLSAALNRKWGMQVIIKPRAKDDLREAMQILAGNCAEERIYTHTGWRKLDNKWVFLHTNGAVGAANAGEEASRSLASKRRGYQDW